MYYKDGTRYDGDLKKEKGKEEEFIIIRVVIDMKVILKIISMR